MNLPAHASVPRRQSTGFAKVVLAATLGFAVTSYANAASTATTTATYAVNAINEISLSAPTVSLTVSAAVAGAAPTAVASTGQTYSVTTNQTAKISASIDSAMPTGVNLTAAMTAPTGGTSAGAVSLIATSRDLVTGIATLNESGLALTYGLSATAAAGVVTSASKTVTYTITSIE